MWTLNSWRMLSHLWFVASQVWINQGDIVLLSLRDFQDGKADVIVKYTADEARNRMCYCFLLRNKCAHLLLIYTYSESLWRASRKCQNQWDRYLWRRGRRLHIRFRWGGRGWHRWYLNVLHTSVRVFLDIFTLFYSTIFMISIFWTLLQEECITAIFRPRQTYDSDYLHGQKGDDLKFLLYIFWAY